ncbi:Putative two-component membrane permease complex subunit SMU_747c [Cohnella sp. JJ-181]|nr:Putative two-component membrane permease complex subunit SMU_747c [Cohnella sp. JJ-181]
MTSFLQLNTIFISMIMEAIPFVLIGVLVSGVIQTFVTEAWIARIMPRNVLLRTCFGCGIGVLFPSCECGIVPITRRLVMKGMPLNAGVAFMLSGPIVNPIVLFATFIAFGNDWRMVGIRAGLAIAVAFCVSLTIALIFKDDQLRHAGPAESAAVAPVAAALEPALATPGRPSIGARLSSVVSHGIDEFFDVGKYLVIGALLAAAMQTYIPTSYLLELGSDPLKASLVMIVLAFVMSVCSEADAFIASSFRSSFTVGSLSAFMVFGPMIDIKNTLMLLSAFRTRFVVSLIALVALFTLVGSLLVGRLFG